MDHLARQSDLYRRNLTFNPPLGPRPLITVEVGRKQQCKDNLFINADVQVQSSQVGRWMITCSQAKQIRYAVQLNPESKMLA
jgi:hypothetical protein